MASASHVRYWRWRHNSLRRLSDRIEAWVVLGTGLVIAVGAPAAAGSAVLATLASAPHPPPGWEQTTAVVTRQAPPSTAARNFEQSSKVSAAVSWRAAGSVHTGQALVRPGSPAGTRVTMWLDTAGVPRSDPVDLTAVRSRAVTFGTLAFAGTALLGAGGRAASVSLLDRRRADDLAREWRRIGPQWGTADHG